MPINAPVATATSAANLVDLYLRLSNADDGADSVQRQEADLRGWAEREGLVVRTVWTDYGVSGFKDVPRDGFESAVQAVRAGEVKTLAVWKLDRLSRRGMKAMGDLLEVLDRASARMFSLQENIDTSMGSAARIPLAILAEIAKAESDNTSLRVRSRKARDRAAGRYLGGSAPYGYTVDTDRRLRQRADEAPLVREAIDRLMAGEAMVAIASDWNDRGVPTRRGGLWRASTLSAIVRSPTLSGLMPQLVRKKETVDGVERERVTIHTFRNDDGEAVSLMANGHAPISSVGEQSRLLAVLDTRYRRYGRGARPIRRPKSLLGTLAKCAECGRSLVLFGESYRCRKTQADGTVCAAPVSVQASVLDAFARRAWASHLAALEPDSAVLDAVADRWLDRYEPAPLREREEVLADLLDAEASQARADDDFYVRKTLDSRRYSVVSEALAAQIAMFRARLGSLPTPDANLGALLDPEISLPAIEAASVPEARTLLALAVRAVYVSKAEHPGQRFDPTTRVRFEWVGR